MNQKRITNQILEQKNYTLNSTLNYLFNISNMKKLFSYLLISSMVVLSSCTNYDDQFDDLNTQINTLKSQIEGFSSLSSGLTALQGTVASLQTAIANIPVTPATDISGLESTQAALQTALTALATEVTALQTTLATAATSTDVADLTAALDKVKADLADLLASNNIYTPADAVNGLVINSASSLTVAEALGDKLAIVNGSVKIENTAAAAMDNTRLQALADKLVTITGKLTYTHSGSSVSSVDFNNLTSTGDLTINQNAPISLPKLTTAAAVDLSATTSLKVTSVSAPELTSVTSLVDVSFSQATSFSMPKFKGESGNKALSITLKSKSTIDLAAYDTANSDTGLEETGHSLTLRGPSAVALPLFITGTLDTDAEVLTMVGLKSAPTTSAAKLKEVHLHNLQGAITFGATYSKLEIVDIIGTYEKTGTATVVAGPRLTDVTLGSANIETLTLAGALGEVTITNAGSLASVTTSGGMRSFSVTGATSLTELTLGHGANASSTLKRSDLVVSGATSLTKLTADSINNANKLTIEDNTELTTVSLAALVAVSTEVDASKKALVPVVQIDNNKFTVQSFQLPSAYQATPAVTGKITSDSGLNGLQKYFDKAIAVAKSKVYVEYDYVLKALDAAGKVYETGSDNTDTASVTYGATAALAVSVKADNSTAFAAINVSPDTRTYNDTDAVFQTNSSEITGSALSNSNVDPVISFNGGEGAVSTTLNSTWTGLISDFNASDLSTFVPEIAASLQAKVDAAGYDYAITSHNDYGAKATYVPQVLTGGSVDYTVLSTAGAQTRYVFVGVGTTIATGTLATADKGGLADAIVNAFHKVGSPLSGVWSAVSNSDDNIVLTRLKRVGGTARTPIQDLGYTSYPSLAYTGYSSATTQTNAMLEGASFRAIKTEAKGWRLRAVNNDQDYNASNLEAGANAFNFTENGGAASISASAVGAAGQFATSSSTMQISFANVVKADYTADGGGSPASTVDFTAWL
ncbi:hypothetical protein N8Z88_07590 [Flavobacteriaceae bacterium]|nr:hypothetical protein [Flavobacteriaceae bacterium]